MATSNSGDGPFELCFERTYDLTLHGPVNFVGKTEGQCIAVRCHSVFGAHAQMMHKLQLCGLPNKSILTRINKNHNVNGYVSHNCPYISIAVAGLGQMPHFHIFTFCYCYHTMSNKCCYYASVGGTPEAYGSCHVCLSVCPFIHLYFQVTFLHHA